MSNPTPNQEPVDSYAVSESISDAMWKLGTETMRKIQRSVQQGDVDEPVTPRVNPHEP